MGLLGTIRIPAWGMGCRLRDILGSFQDRIHAVGPFPVFSMGHPRIVPRTIPVLVMQSTKLVSPEMNFMVIHGAPDNQHKQTDSKHLWLILEPICMRLGPDNGGSTLYTS